MIRAVLFDFDMTLIDSSYGVTFCLNRVAEAFGLRAVTRDEVLRTIGYPMEKAMEMLWNFFQPSWIEYYRNNLVTFEHERLVPLPGVEESLRRLHERDIAMAVVSNRNRILPAIMSTGLEGFFSHLVGMEDVDTPKPDPQSILIALGRLWELPENAVLVGDSEVDARASKAAGIRFIGLTTSGRLRADLLAEGAYSVVDDFPEIISLILEDRQSYKASAGEGVL